MMYELKQRENLQFLRGGVIRMKPFGRSLVGYCGNAVHSIAR